MGQITLRCSDINRSLEFYQNMIGMKLLSIQTVEKYGFTLYFLAFTDEVPPAENLHSVQIREWLWQRPYTTLELQHKPGSEIRKMVDEGLGVECIEMKINDYEIIKQNLASAGFTMLSSRSDNERNFQAIDPDGAKITFFST